VHRETLDILRDHDTTSRALTDFDIDPADHPDGIAVIGPDLLTPLERSILPAEYTAIEPFQNATHELEPFRVFDSSAAIVDALMHVIDRENADDIAVVLNGSGQYSALVESALEAEDIPFYGGPDFIDRNHHRAFLQLLRILTMGSTLRVADIRPLFAELDVGLAIDHDAKRVDILDQSALEWLQELHLKPSLYQVADIVEIIDDRTVGDMADLREELDSLSVLQEPVTESVVSRLFFYFQRYNVPVDRDNEGVLLAEATSAAFVDRPLVFYLGLAQDWTHSTPQRPWIDSDEIYARNLKEFQLLLQNGQEQYYLVQDTQGGEPVSPTIYFEDLLDEDFERFTDLNSRLHTRSYHDTGDGFDHENRNVEVEPVEAISQSSLNSYVNSPRDYFFSELLDSPDQDYFEEGTWFHDFAEVYATHPEKIGPDDIETVVENMKAAVSPFVDNLTSDLRGTTYRIGLEQIARYLDTHPPEVEDAEPDWKPYAGNHVADLLGLEADGPHTEIWFRDADLGIKGSIDLRRTDTELVDYKKGGHKSPRKRVANAARDPPGDTPNYQAIMYLARQRTDQPETPLDFTFHHFLETFDERVTGEKESLDDCLSTVSYYPETFHEHIQRESVYEYLRDEHYNDCNDTFQAISYETYREAVPSEPPPETTDKDELTESEFGQTFITNINDSVASHAQDPAAIDAEKGANQALRHFASINAESFFAPDIDDFETFVADRLDELNRRLSGEERFPVTDLKDEPNERRLDHQDLLLEGDT
jgi:hypothetical protein